MIRKIAVLLLVLFVTTCITPYLVAAEREKTSKEKPLWEIIADSFAEFKVREQDKLKTSSEVSIFQEISDAIKKGTSSAKNQSLRGK